MQQMINKETAAFKINVLCGKANLMQEVLSELYKKTNSLEHVLYDKLRICEPYLYDMKVMQDSKKYPTGKFRGKFPPILFPDSKEDLDTEEAEQIVKDMELILKVYNAFYLNVEHFVFGLEELLKEIGFIRDYYFGLQLAKIFKNGGRNPEKKNLCFIPRLTGFNSLLEVKQEQFLEKTLQFLFLGSSTCSQDIMSKGPGEFSQEDYFLLLRNLAEQKEILNGAFNCRMIPAEKPCLIRKNYELFHDDDKMMERVSRLGGR